MHLSAIWFPSAPVVAVGRPAGNTPRPRTTGQRAALALPVAGLLGLSFLAGAPVAYPASMVAPQAAVDPGEMDSVDSLTVRADQTTVLSRSTRTKLLAIAQGGRLVAPAGYGLTLTVGGVETGALLTRTGGTETALQPGTYVGDVVLTVTETNPVPLADLTFPLRQSLYLTATGVVPTRSVLSSVVVGDLDGTTATDLQITSTGEAFTGVYVAEGQHSLVKPVITMSGNGRSDVVGYGAAVVGSGAGTRLVVDGATIRAKGAVRTGVVAKAGADVLVKNSGIITQDGILPSDYRPTVDTTLMESAPWMLGLSGNNRATNLVGENTRAAYLNSTVASQNWGALSTEDCRNSRLTTVGSRLVNTGKDGFGASAEGDAVGVFLGTQFDVASYAVINDGGSVSFGDSTAEAVSRLNQDLDWRLTTTELAALPNRSTVVNSGRFGVMWQGPGSVDISGGTQINSKEATFLVKDAAAVVTVDGSQGATLSPANGVLFQLMDDDNPGPQNVGGVLLNTGVYTESTGQVARNSGFDVTTAHSGDATASFSDAVLTGDFFNSVRGNTSSSPGRNLVLTFDRTQLTGALSATQANHSTGTLGSQQYRELGVVTNTARPVVNNGVVVTLGTGSRWTVTGTSYLSRLVLAAEAQVVAPSGKTLVMTVNGVEKPITPGSTQTGEIALSLR